MPSRVRVEWVWRFLAAQLALALIATCLALGAAAPANAGVQNLIPSNEFGEPTETFTADQALFFYATSDLQGGRVCVVSAAGPLDSLSCNSGDTGSWDEGNVVGGVGTIFALLEGPYLMPGTWRLLSETLPTLQRPEPEPLAVSQPFTVTPCGDSCDPMLAADIVSEFKKTTLASHEIYYDACVGYAIRDAYGAVRGMAADTQQIVADAYSGKVLQDAVIEQLKLDQEFKWDFGSGQVAFSLSGGASLTFVPLDEAAHGQEEKAKEILHSLICVLGSAYADLANDPPDPAYTVVEAATTRPVMPLGDPVSDALGRQLDDHVGFAYADLSALERYQSAEAAGDRTSVHRQAGALAKHTSLLASSTLSTAQTLRDYAGLLDASQEFTAPVIPDAASLETLRALFARVTADGFTAAESDALVQLGIDAVGVSSLRKFFAADVTRVPVGITFQDQLRALADRLAGQRSGLTKFARAAAAVAGATNTAPVADFTADATGQLNYQFTSTAVSPDGDAISSSRWDFGDGAIAEGTSVAHAFAATGTYAVTHEVCDAYACHSSTRQIPVGLIGEPPSASFTVDMPRTEGRLLTLDASASSDPDGRIVRYDWDFGDGETFPGGGETVNHTYQDDGTYLVRLTVTDEAENTDTAQLEVVVDNVAPSVTPQLAARVPATTTRSYEATVTDPGSADQRTVTWDFGDGTSAVVGSPTSGQASRVQHAYGSDGTYTISITANDGDGGVTTEERQILVAAPTADAGADQSVEEGGPVTLGGPGTSPSDLGSTQFVWDFGDGTSGFGRTASHVYRDEGTYTAILRVSDYDLPDVVVTSSASVAVRNVAPSVSVLAPSAGTPQEALSMRAFPTDPGDDELSVTWDFGDGDTATGNKVTHSFAAGPHTVTVVVTDGDGGEVSVERRIGVSADPPGDGQRDTRGTDVWLAFMPGLSNDDPQVFVAGAAGTQGVVEVPGVGFRREFTVGPGAVAKVHLPASLLTTVFDSPLPFGVHVSADSPVSVYGLNQGDFETDGFLALPREVLGTDYYAVGYDGFSGGQMGVLATQNDTTVRVVGRNGQEVTKTLDAGDVYPLYNGHDDQVGRTPVGIDFTGAHLTADKPVAAFSGAMCGNVPTNRGACNHLVEQLTPTSQWGRTFLTAPFATRKDGDRIRVVAARAGTEVRVNGAMVATLGPGDFYEQVVEGGALVEATEPVQLAQFAHSFGWDLIEGDPTMALVVPYEQYLSSYVVATADEPFTAHYLNVVTPITQIGELELDGDPVASDAFHTIGTSGYAYAQLRVDVGTHRLSGPRPFGLMQYGWGVFDAYSWFGGSQLAAVATITGLSLSPAVVDAAVGEKFCLDAAVVDAEGAPVTGARVDWTSTGANPDEAFALTGNDGIASICLTAAAPGEDRVTARVAGLTDSSTITWTGVNAAPTATAASVSTLAGVSAPITLAGTDADDDPLTFAVAVQPAHGTLSGTAPTLTYSPDAGFIGADSFTFTTNDGTVTSSPATVSLTVLPVNRAPTAQAQAVSTPEDTAISVSLAGTDPDGDYLDFTVTGLPSHGSLTGTAPALTYVPDADYSGPDSLIFRVCDDGTTEGRSDFRCDIATVSITVTPVNDLPVVTSTSSSRQVQYSDAISGIAVSATDVDTASSALGATVSWKKLGDPTFATSIPLGGLTLTAVSATSTSPRTWWLTGNALVGVGTYIVRVAVSDGQLTAATDVTFVVGAETAALAYTADALVMTESTGTADIKVAAAVVEAADGALGDQLGSTFVRFDAYGSSDTAMTSPAGSCTGAVTPSGSGSSLAGCTIAGLRADAYTVVLRLLPSPYYTAPPEAVVVAVVLPSAGQANGGGWLLDPTQGTRSSFGFTAKALKNGRPQGSSVYIYQRVVQFGSVINPAGGFLPAGDYNWLVKSNAVTGMASTCGTTTNCTATFTAKANVTAVHRASGTAYPLGGNYDIQVDVADGGEPATQGAMPDAYAIRVSRARETGYQLGSPTNKIPIQGGNIQVKR